MARDENQGDIFQAVRPERIAAKVANQLRKVISQGIYRAGDRLPPERELAQRMGVSRPSVREAIQQLEHQGIVETVRGGGSIVRNLTEQEIRKPMEIFLGDDPKKVLELTEVRALMEVWAAREAAIHRKDEQLGRMQRCLEEMEGDFERGRIRYEVDFSFHSEIAAASHNTVFLHLIDSIHQLIAYSIKVHREKVFVGRGDQERILCHHLKIFKAIKERQADVAQAAMEEHLHFVVAEFTKWSDSH
jgi:GntR family transcriptional regulator, transcriptional repressor for pyruvate dehydrogenase complex